MSKSKSRAPARQPAKTVRRARKATNGQRPPTTSEILDMWQSDAFYFNELALKNYIPLLAARQSRARLVRLVRWMRMMYDHRLGVLYRERERLIGIASHASDERDELRLQLDIERSISGKRAVESDGT